MNSITTNIGNKANGIPAGTNKEKNLSPCLAKPNIVAPNTTTEDKDIVRIMWLVEAKL